MPPNAIATCNLTPEQKEVLIEAVKSRPAIWNCTSEEYNDGNCRKIAYAEVADLLSTETVQYTAAEMQTEWKKMRDIFNRTLKKVIAGTNPKDVTWRYWQKMQFIAENEKHQIMKCVRKWNKMAQKYKTEVSSNDGSDFPFKHFVENSVMRMDSAENFSSEDGDLGQESSSAQMTLDWLANYQCPSFNLDEPEIKPAEKIESHIDSEAPNGNFVDPTFTFLHQNDTSSGPLPKKRRVDNHISPASTSSPTNLSHTPEAEIFGAPHKRQERRFKSLVPKNSTLSESGPFRCDICDITVNAQKMLDSHHRGKPHQKKVARAMSENNYRFSTPMTKSFAGFDNKIETITIPQTAGFWSDFCENNENDHAAMEADAEDDKNFKKPPVTWDDLPNEILCKITEYVGSPDIEKLRLVNKKLNAILVNNYANVPIYHMHKMVAETAMKKRTNLPKPSFKLRKENTNGLKRIIKPHKPHYKERLRYCRLKNLAINWGFKEERVLTFFDEIKELSGVKLKIDTAEIWYSADEFYLLENLPHLMNDLLDAKRLIIDVDKAQTFKHIVNHPEEYFKFMNPKLQVEIKMSFRIKYAFEEESDEQKLLNFLLMPFRIVEIRLMEAQSFGFVKSFLNCLHNSKTKSPSKTVKFWSDHEIPQETFEELGQRLTMTPDSEHFLMRTDSNDVIIANKQECLDYYLQISINL